MYRLIFMISLVGLFAACGVRSERFRPCNESESQVAEGYFYSSGLLLEDYFEGLSSKAQYKKATEFLNVCDQILSKDQSSSTCYTEPDGVRMLHDYSAMKEKCVSVKAEFTDEILEKLKLAAEEEEESASDSDPVLTE